MALCIGSPWLERQLCSPEALDPRCDTEKIPQIRKPLQYVIGAYVLCVYELTCSSVVVQLSGFVQSCTEVLLCARNLEKAGSMRMFEGVAAVENVCQETTQPICSLEWHVATRERTWG